jgi:uncharacterized tellurite resistance protein B-like protein
MAKTDIGKNLKNTLQGAAESVKTSIKDVDLTKIKVPKMKAPPQVKDMFMKKGTAKTPAEAGEQAPVGEGVDMPVAGTALSKNAIKIIYYLMAADGEIFHGEEAKFDSICAEFDPAFDKNKEPIVNECRNHLDKQIDGDDYFDVIQDGVEEAVASFMAAAATGTAAATTGAAGTEAAGTEAAAADTALTPKLLIWNLLAIAYSDANYNETERKLIKYIVRKLGVDKAVFLEMESSVLTMMDLEKELSWIKTTDRPYLTIEAIVVEIENKKKVVLQSVKELISL